MNRKVVVLFVSISLFGLGKTVFAQTEENPELQKTIQVYSEYKPQISDANRISVNPKVYDTLDIQMNLKYSLSTSPLNTDYHIIPLKAVSVKGDKLQELYRGEVVVGVGNYLTGLLAVRYMTERSSKKQSGVEFYHRGSAGKVKMDDDSKVPAGYTTDYISAYWKRFYEKFSLQMSVKPQYLSVLRYGYNQDTFNLIDHGDKKSIRRNNIGISAEANLNSNSTDEHDLRYNAAINYDFDFLGNPTNLENLVAVKGGIEQKLERISLGLVSDIQLDALNFTPKDVDSALSKMQGVAHIQPFMSVGANGWSLKVGIKASPMFGGINAFKIYPDVAFTYHVPDLKMVPYFNLYGDVKLNSMKDMFLENPYVSDSIMLRPTINKLGFDLGIDGRIKKLITYNASFAVRAYDDMYFWHENSKLDKLSSLPTTTQPIESVNTTYGVLYDNATLMKMHADLGFLFRKCTFRTEANFYHWQMDSLKHAWYKPIFDVAVAPRFALVNPNTNKTKLMFEPQLYYMLYQSEKSDGSDFAKNSIIDLGFEVQYFYNSILEFFVDVNNILSRNNERYMDYPTQRINFLIGASFSFGGHKE